MLHENMFVYCNNQLTSQNLENNINLTINYDLHNNMLAHGTVTNNNDDNNDVGLDE